MTNLTTIVRFLDDLLQPARFPDNCLNGLEVESSTLQVVKVAASVDAGLSVMEEAVKRQAQLLLVHHGMMWGGNDPIRGIFGAKVRTLLKGGCSLYASHLPLDAHPEVGNNFEAARALGLLNLTPFAEHKGMLLGAYGDCERPYPLDYFVKQTAAWSGNTRQVVLPFGGPTIRRVGIVTGSGTFAAHACPEAGVDLFISGEPKQEAYHLAKELGLNMIFAGHYATETFGVQALLKLLASKYSLETTFIDEPTGI